MDIITITIDIDIKMGISVERVIGILNAVGIDIVHSEEIMEVFRMVLKTFIYSDSGIPIKRGSFLCSGVVVVSRARTILVVNIVCLNILDFKGELKGIIYGIDILVTVLGM